MAEEAVGVEGFMLVNIVVEKKKKKTIWAGQAW
jgi:hypothetical protein